MNKEAMLRGFYKRAQELNKLGWGTDDEQGNQYTNHVMSTLHRDYKAHPRLIQQENEYYDNLDIAHKSFDNEQKKYEARNFLMKMFAKKPNYEEPDTTPITPEELKSMQDFYRKQIASKPKLKDKYFLDDENDKYKFKSIYHNPNLLDEALDTMKFHHSIMTAAKYNK